MIELTPEQEARLAEIANEGGRTPESFATEVSLHVLESDPAEAQIVSERLAFTDRGLFLEEEEMDQRFQKMIAR